MYLLWRHNTFLYVLDHSQMMTNRQIAQLLANQPQHYILYINTRLVQTLNQSFGQVLLIVQQETVFGWYTHQQKQYFSEFTLTPLII
jgi:hypothetical protein